MDLVIFWMFLMDFNRMVMSFKVAMFLTCPHCGLKATALVLANMVASSTSQTQELLNAAEVAMGATSA